VQELTQTQTANALIGAQEENRISLEVRKEREEDRGSFPVKEFGKCSQPEKAVSRSGAEKGDHQIQGRPACADPPWL
jgi:hypothetical protein